MQTNKRLNLQYLWEKYKAENPDGLSYSRFCKRYLDWKNELGKNVIMVQNRAHVNALRYLGVVPRVIVPDNCKTATTKPSYYDPAINRTYGDFAQHYEVAILSARISEPQDYAEDFVIPKVINTYWHYYVFT